MSNIDNIFEFLEETKKLSLLEQDETQISTSPDDGGNSEEASKGYHRACCIFLEINQDNLTRSQKEELEKAISILENLNLEAKIIKTSQNKIYEGLVLKNTSKERETRARLDELANSQYQQLILKEEKYINYGYAASLIEDESQPTGYKVDSGHAEIMKLRFEGNQETGIGQYFVSIYNAGDGTKFVNPKKSSVEARRYYKANFQTKDEAINFIKLCNERTITGTKGLTAEKFRVIDQHINQQLEKLPYHNSEQAQTRGNCTTRSIREALREILSPEIFSEFYNFVSNRPILEQRIGEYLISKEQRQSSPPAYNPRKILFQTKIREGGIDLPDVTADLISEQFTYNNNEKGTLLHYAIAKKNLSLFETLVIQHNMDGTERNKKGYSALEYSINIRNSDAAIAFIEHLIDSRKRDKLEELNIYGRTPILSAIENDQLEIINCLIEGHINLSAQKNNNYSIIKRLGEKAISSDKELASEYLDVMSKILETYSIHELEIEVKDINKKDILDVAHKIIRAQKSELPEKSREFLVNLYKKDMESDNPIYTEANLRMLASLKMMKNEDIKTFSPNLVMKNPNFFLQRVDLELSKAKKPNTSSLDYLANMEIPELNQGLFEILTKSLKSGKHSPESLNLKEETVQKLVHNLSFDSSQEEELRETFTKFFNEDIANSLISKISFTEPPQNQKSNQDRIETENLDDYLAELDQGVQKIKEQAYQFGDFTRGLLNSLGLQNLSYAIGLGKVREDAPSTGDMLYNAGKTVYDAISYWTGSSEEKTAPVTVEDKEIESLKNNPDVQEAIKTLKNNTTRKAPHRSASTTKLKTSNITRGA